MCRRCTLYGKVLAAYGQKQPMPCANILHVWDPQDIAYLLDTTAEEFLRDALEQVDVVGGGKPGLGLLPIQVTGDGNCLAHSISRACHGEEVWYSLLRKKVEGELRTNKAWYLDALPHVDEEIFDNEARAAGELGVYMDAGTGLHLLALAHVLKRPVVLMASREHMEDATRSSCGTYLPLRVPPADLATKVPVIVAWQSDSFVYQGAGHFVCVSPTMLGPAVLPPGWLPGTCPRLDDADCTTLAQYLALEADGSVIIPNDYQPAKIHRIVGDYSTLGNGAAELVTGGKKRFQELVPAGVVVNIHARLIIYCCNMAEEDAQQMEARETGTIGFNTVAPDSMLAVLLQLYAYMCELPRLTAVYYASMGQEAPARHDTWASQRLQKCVDDLRTICHRSPALVSRLDHQIDLYAISELQAERALYATVYAAKPIQGLAHETRLQIEEEMVVKQMDARQPGRTKPGHVLLRPLIREGEMEKEWLLVKEQQATSDMLHLRKVRHDLAVSEEDQALLQQLPLTPRSPRRRQLPANTSPRRQKADCKDDDGSEEEFEGEILTKVSSAPSTSGRDEDLAEKMGVKTSEVEGASRDTMIEHILQLTDIFAVPKAHAIPSPAPAPSQPVGSDLRSAESTVEGDYDDGALLQRGKSVPTPSFVTAVAGETDEQQELVRVQELWASNFLGRARSDGSESDAHDVDDGFNLQVRVGGTFLTLPVHPSTTCAEVKTQVEANLGPRAAEQVLLIYAKGDVDQMNPTTLEDTDTLSSLDSSSTVVCASIHDAKVTSDGQNKGFSRRTEIMMRRNKVMEAVLKGWAGVDPGSTPTVVKARLDPNRTSEAEFNVFVHDQHTLIRHARERLGLPTTDMILEQMIAQHTAELERDLVSAADMGTAIVPPEGVPRQNTEPATATGPALEAAPEPEIAPEPESNQMSVPVCDDIEVVFRVMVKGVAPFGRRFPVTATTAQVQAYLEATMAESGMAGDYELKETGFPPRRLVPSDQSLVAAGLATDAKITLQVSATMTSTSSSASAHSPRQSMEPPDELAPGGAVYESIKSKYVGKGAGGLESGRAYRAPLMRGRSFIYDPVADRLVDAPVRDAGARAAGERGHQGTQDEPGLAAIWRKMFEGVEGEAMLKPGGTYYSEAARSLGVPASGPLNPSLVYSFPNPIMRYAGDDTTNDEHTLHFYYDGTADHLVYSHAGTAETAPGGALERSSSAQLQGEALRSWSHTDFMRPACLRPGGLLYMNAMDSFGDLSEDKLYFFPHFGPIKTVHFRYRADIDQLVCEEEQQSDFVKRATITRGHAKASYNDSPSGGTGGSTLGSTSGGYSGTMSAEPEPEPDAGTGTGTGTGGNTMTDAERAREARLRRYGQ